MSQQVGLAAKPAALGRGLAIVKLMPLPREQVRDALGKLQNVEMIHADADGNWQVQFEVIRWIEQPAKLTRRQATLPVRKRFGPREGDATSPTMQAQELQDRLFLAEVFLDQGMLEGGELWFAGGVAPNRMMANEAAGMEELKELRQFPDLPRQARRFRELAGTTGTPSLVLALEGGNLLADPNVPDSERVEVAYGWLELMLRSDVDGYVQNYAKWRLDTVGVSGAEARANFKEYVTFRLVQSFHELAPRATVAPEKTQMALRCLKEWLPQSLPRSARALPLDQLHRDLSLRKDRLSLPEEQAREIINLIDQVEAMLRP